MGDLLWPGADDRRRHRPPRREPAGADPRRLGLRQVVVGQGRRPAETGAPVQPPPRALAHLRDAALGRAVVEPRRGIRRARGAGQGPRARQRDRGRIQRPLGDALLQSPPRSKASRARASACSSTSSRSCSATRRRRAATRRSCSSISSGAPRPGRATRPRRTGVDLHVIVTMRSEFLGECARFAGFAETINRTQYLVPRMDDDGLLRAVRRPAQMYGADFDESLAERLIASVRGREDELPLLQHGLMLMWEDAERRPRPGERKRLDGGDRGRGRRPRRASVPPRRQGDGFGRAGRARRGAGRGGVSRPDRRQFRGLGDPPAAPFR